MSFFGRLVLTFLPITPKFVIKFFAKRYVAGESQEQAIEYVKGLNQRGFVATIDVLGEDVFTEEQTHEARDDYLKLVPAIAQSGVDGNVSLKLTALGLKMDLELCWENLKAILDEVKKADNFLRIDMEDPPVIGVTLDMYRKAREYYPKVGCVLQANVKRADEDVPQMILEQSHFRLCKGVYNEPKEDLIFDYQEVRERMLDFGKQMLDAGTYVGLATHDDWLIQRFEEYIKEKDIPKDQYEWQALIGVPIDATLERLVAEGHKVRYYVPFGENWLAYSRRRLKENPDIASKAIGAMLRWPWFGKNKRRS